MNNDEDSETFAKIEKDIEVVSTEDRAKPATDAEPETTEPSAQAEPDEPESEETTAPDPDTEAEPQAEDDDTDEVESDETTQDDVAPASDGGESRAEGTSKRGARKRIKELTRDNYEARQRVRELERQLADQTKAPPSQPPASQPSDDRPTSDKFDDYDDYIDALTDWKVEQKLAKTAPAETPRAAPAAADVQTPPPLHPNLAMVREDYDDFDAVLMSQNAPVSNIMADFAEASEDNARALYQVLKSAPETAAKIATLTNPFEVASAFAAHASRDLTDKPGPSDQSSSNPPAVTKASRPPSTGKTRGEARRRIKEDDSEFMTDDYFDQVQGALEEKGIL